MCGCCSRKEEEGNDSSVRVTVAGEGGGYGVSVRSAQWWLRLRAREAAAEAALAGGRSKGERRGLCAGGAATEEEGSGDVKQWWVATGRQMRQWQAAVKKVGWKRQMREERKTAAEGVRLLRQERRKGRAACNIDNDDDGDNVNDE
ncbi:hypothetical protein BHM03_00049339 [Ensete ventricosum]|nr:hypothetical protein BHM03_00049339 [Ensete ventricosum]